jgi:hypothetical protein
MGSSMQLARRFRKFRHLSGTERLALGEAITFLGLARILVLTAPFHRYAPWLARAPENGSCDPQIVQQVRWAVTTASRIVPWNAVCLPQAIAAKAMLARRGCGSSFHLGANFDANHNLTAHAWLVAGGSVVIGEGAMPTVAPLVRLG